MNYPEKIFATETVGSNGISCLDYRNTEGDVEYIRADKANANASQLEALVRARLEELGRDFLTYLYDNADVLMYDSELENLQPLLEEIEENGFIVKEKYDSKIHGDAFEAEEGDEVWIFTEEMKRIATAELKKRGYMLRATTVRVGLL